MQFTKKITTLQELNFLHGGKFKIGILGGSFDPAHDGHLLISKQALQHYNLDYIIWLVANQNPHKHAASKNCIQRANFARNFLSNENKIIVSTLEYELNYYYTIDSVKYITNKFPNIEFNWLMGVDNIRNLHKWQRIDEFKKLMNIIIFDRPCDTRLLNPNSFITKSNATLDKSKQNPIMIYRGKLCDLSSSEIKSKK